MSERNNLMTRNVMSTGQETSWLYVVHDGKDYRLNLAVLLQMITKNRLGLENVNNTSDADKPISSATQLELNKKANISDIVTQEAFQLLADQMQLFITANEVSTIITNIQQIIAGKEDQGVAETLINEQLTPIRESLINAINRIEILENTNAEIVTNTSLQETLSGYREQILNEARNEASSVIQNLSSSFQTLSLEFTTLREETQNTLVMINERLAFLEENQCNLIIGVMDW